MFMKVEDGYMRGSKERAIQCCYGKKHEEKGVQERREIMRHKRWDKERVRCMLNRGAFLEFIGRNKGPFPLLLVWIRMERHSLFVAE